MDLAPLSSLPQNTSARVRRDTETVRSTPQYAPLLHKIVRPASLKPTSLSVSLLLPMLPDVITYIRDNPVPDPLTSRPTMAVLDDKSIPPPYTEPDQESGPPTVDFEPPPTPDSRASKLILEFNPDSASASTQSLSGTTEVDDTKTPMTDAECKAALKKLDSRIRKYNWGNRSTPVERSIVSSMRNLSTRHPDSTVREYWEKRADGFEKAPEVDKGAILKDIGLAVGMLLAAPFAITGAVLMGMGLLLKESGSLLSGGRLGGKKSKSDA
ncbi:unnamed protein product [Mycena citricolor]|uniref:Uncharacterized protein n=1 Tax=Mycena citricolor TaxID=2018698 RepID=A0AAD2I001_9AGAR|nr:unnamed protein product [Mycena citricolor]